MTGEDTAPTVARFRSVLSSFASGVTIVTGGGETPAGFTCQSFFSVSLEPPLIAISPSVHSTSWSAIAETGVFTVNVLGAGQDELALRFGRPAVRDRFSGIDWSRGATGAPRLAGALAWIDCRLEAVHPAGDHHVVLGRVAALDAEPEGKPLTFFRSRFARLSPVPLQHAEWDADLIWGSGPWLPALDDVDARSPLEGN